MDELPTEQQRSWQELEALLEGLERQGLTELHADDVRELQRLYRRASAELLLARGVGDKTELTDYLEALVARAYTTLHAPRPLDWRAGKRFFTTYWPRIVRREHPYLLAAAATIALGFLLSWLLCRANSDAFDHLMPAEVIASHGEQPDDYRAERFGDLADEDAALFSAYLVTNNIRVSLKAFAYGLTAGIGTCIVLFFNGAMLGAIAANFGGWKMSMPFWALILPHGIIEIFSIALCGGGGYILADALLRPGRRSRLDSLRSRARDAVALAAMAIPMLAVAALIEGFITPLAEMSDPQKLAFAAATALALALYIKAPWLHREPDSEPQSFRDAPG